jgi:hypothetical protein
MSMTALKYVSDLMESLNIPYAFGEWKEKPPDRYWVGTYIEPESLTREENGRQDTTFILRGYTRGAWLPLEEDKAKIEREASQTAVLADGTGIAVSYAGADVVPTFDSDIVSMKINLEINEWSVN